MFNNPTCLWWSAHQQSEDHEHYLKGVNVVEAMDYAKTIASEVRDLLCLRHIHIGLYFVPLEAVTAHRSLADHTRYHCIKDCTKWVDGVRIQSAVQFNAKWAADHPGVPPPNVDLPRLANRGLWATPCPRCIEQWSEVSGRAERAAASMLAAELPQLETVSFSSFVTEGRVAPSEWAVRRFESSPSPDGEEQVWIGTERPGTQRSLGKGLLFRQSGTGWIVWTKSRLPVILSWVL
ncbi:F-box-like domain-containing protein [Ceratobasidium sp. AG-Ba]|nr:F-box-like domain-containing protein [Ceratobasidium sp. AG-Ba]